MAGTVEESGIVEGECALPLCAIISSWKMKMMISFVNWFELYLTQRETKSTPELPVGVSELHPTAALFIRSSQQHYRVLAVFACSSHLVWMPFRKRAGHGCPFSFFSFKICVDKGAPAAVYLLCNS